MSVTKNLENNENLYRLAYNVVIENEIVSFTIHDPTINLGVLYGIFVTNNNRLAIHNRIYREVIINYMTARMHSIQLANRADFGGDYNNDKRSITMDEILNFHARKK